MTRCTAFTLYREFRIAGHEISALCELGLAVKVVVKYTPYPQTLPALLHPQRCNKVPWYRHHRQKFRHSQCQPNDCLCLLVEGRDLVLADGLVEVQQICDFTICDWSAVLLVP